MLFSFCRANSQRRNKDEHFEKITRSAARDVLRRANRNFEERSTILDSRRRKDGNAFVLFLRFEGEERERERERV